MQEFTKANTRKLDAHWLEVMRQAKTEELHAEIALLADEGWHSLKRKEGLVKVSMPVAQAIESCCKWSNCLQIVYLIAVVSAGCLASAAFCCRLWKLNWVWQMLKGGR